MLLLVCDVSYAVIKSDTATASAADCWWLSAAVWVPRPSTAVIQKQF